MAKGAALQLIIISGGGLIGDMMGQWIILSVDETQTELLGNLPRKIEFSLKIRKVDEDDSIFGRFLDALSQ